MIINAALNFNKCQTRYCAGEGFTLLELIIVIVIIGVLATLGYTQYTKIIEKGRQAEARSIIGLLRKNVIAYYNTYGTVATMSNADVGIGTGLAPAYGSCDTNHFYGYYFGGPPTQYYYSLSAIRCTGGGKSPQGTSDFSIGWCEDLSTGSSRWTESDTWASRTW